MPDDMEQIEARLAAYVDGTLPPDQRVEIEAYLKANPTHARLITELKSIKAAVIALPKEKAPAEVLDSLQSHLERHTLLEGVEESVSASRINRWPQLGALAAVLLLAAGLGLLVYQVLPRQGGSSPELALLPDTKSTTQDHDTDLTVATPAAGGVDLVGDKAKRVDRAAPLEKTVGDPITLTPPVDAVPPDEAARPADARTLNQLVYPNQSTANDALRQSAATPSLAAGAAPLGRDANEIGAGPASTAVAPVQGPVRLLVLTSDDPAMTQNLLYSYFAQTQTQFERVDAVPPATMSADPAATQTRWSTALDGVRADAVIPTPADRPLIVRGLLATQLAEIEAAISGQRPTRQRASVSWLATAPAAAPKLSTTNPTNQPTTGPTTTASATRPATLAAAEAVEPAGQKDAPAAGDAQAVDPVAAARVAAPTSRSNEPADGEPANLVVIVVAAPATQPATAPATLPASAAP